MGNESSSDLPPSVTDDPSSTTYPGSTGVRLEVDVDAVERRHHTSGFSSDRYLLVRRDAALQLILHAREKLRVSSATFKDTITGSLQALEVQSHAARRAGTEVSLLIPADAAVGEYELRVEGSLESGTTFEAALRRRVVVLFNAWSSKDGVYLEDERLREEYVRTDMGRVYAGSVYGMPWNLALYREDTLGAVLMLLERSLALGYEARRDPVRVAREMSAMVNVQDDNGILVGNWSGEYSDGTSPSTWRGSAKILRHYYRSGGKPVRYGQCWVFSGVLLSVLRVLGIPARSVTNFGSAHDTDRNRSIEEYYTADGEKINYSNTGSDSVWNFHVWNEVWLSRPDLPAGFGGWQAVDATPQEESPQGGGYRTGPAPIIAVKEGNTVNYDANFVIAEVNADIKKYRIGEDGVPTLFEVDMESVGRDISTKAVGSSRREDLTHHYKHPEGSEAERAALYHGYEELMKEVHDMTFEIPEHSYKFGEDVNFAVKMTNKAKQHVVKGTITCEAVDYRGKLLREVKKEKVNTKVNKGKTETVTMTIGWDIFTEYPRTKVYLKFTVVLVVDGTTQIFSKEVRVTPDPPGLVVTVPPRLSLGSEARATVTFVNPLALKLENVSLTAESKELLQEDLDIQLGTVQPNAELSYSFTVYGLLAGSHQLVVGLDCDQIEMVSGDAEVTVVEGVDEPDAPQPLEVEVKRVDLHLDVNRRVHHTDKYHDGGMIVRRGQLFFMSLALVSPMPSTSTVTARAVFTMQETDRYRRPYSFEVATVCKVTDTGLTVELKTPADVAVGRYQLILAVTAGGKETIVNEAISVVILFNPWSSEDTCYYSQTSDLSEYVLNNQGRIWVGSDRSNYGRSWQFAQFTHDAVEVVLYLLREMGYADRSDPVKVSRHLSAMVNVQDDNGVLVGNWSGDYSGGTSPLAWTGSAEILAQFNNTKQPVSYAQCWVFSGVETTLLRCVGLAARSVTNFNSAHDTQFNRAIDKYFDENGEEMSTGDSIWNFHVWNEVWLSRPDLPAGFGGWQAVDATPQEESPQGGGYRLGPCSVRAVKLGLRMNYDVEFVISEVNADIRYYTVADGVKTLTRVNRTHVGRNISTKAVGSPNRHDLTLDYKFEERSTAERAALFTETESEKEIGIDMSAPPSTIVGEDFELRVTVTNQTTRNHRYTVVVRGRAMLYTGVPGQVVKAMEERITLGPNKSEDLRLSVRAVDYLRILEGGYFIHFVTLVKADNDISLVDTFTFRLKTPDIAITLPTDGLKLYKPAILQVAFKNPLGKTLHNGVFKLFGEGHVQDSSVHIDSIAPRGQAVATIRTIPVIPGPVELVVRFDSNELTDIMGDVETQVS